MGTRVKAGSTKGHRELGDDWKRLTQEVRDRREALKKEVLRRVPGSPRERKLEMRQEPSPDGSWERWRIKGWKLGGTQRSNKG